MLWWSIYLLEIGAPIPIVGLLAMIQNVSNILFQIPGGMLADRFGRKKVIMLRTAGRMVAPLIMILGRTWQQVTPGMVINSFSSLYMPAFNTIIAESHPFESRGAAFGAYRTITSLPQIFMPVISGSYIDRVGIVKGVRTGLVMYILVAVAAFITRSFLLRETLFGEKRQKVKVEKQTSMGALSALMQSLTGSRVLIFMIIISCISGFAMRMIYPFLAIYAVDVKELTTIQWGLLQSIFAVVSTPLFMLGGILSDRISRIPCVIMARAISPVEYLGLITIPNFSPLIVLYILLGVGGGLGGGGLRGGGYMGGPSWQALLVDITPTKNRGKILGLIATMTGLTSMPASVLGGYIWEGSSLHTLLTTGFITGISVVPIIILFVKSPKERMK